MCVFLHVCVCVCEREREKERRRKGGLLPFWASGKSNKIELMGVWSFRDRVGFAGRHWWVMMVVVVVVRMEQDPLSVWQSNRA